MSGMPAIVSSPSAIQIRRTHRSTTRSRGTRGMLPHIMRRMKPRLLVAAALVLAAASLPRASQNGSDPAINQRIRSEEAAHSEIMRTLHYLTDVYGPRLTGSPNQKAAAEWAVKRMTEWGFSNGHLEPWDFGHPGWSNEHLEVHMTAPVHDALVVEALAWTPGTNGTITANAFNIAPPEGPESTTAPARGRGPAHLGPTQAELDAYLATVKDRVRGAAVLVGRPAFVPVSLDGPPGRLPDDQVRCRYDPAAADDPACEGRGRGTRLLRRAARTARRAAVGARGLSAGRCVSRRQRRQRCA